MKKQAKTENASLPDNGGRRSGAERRNFSYTYCIPERRNGQDRRHNHDRRNSLRPKINLKTPKPLEGDQDQADQTGLPS